MDRSEGRTTCFVCDKPLSQRQVSQRGLYCSLQCRNAAHRGIAREDRPRKPLRPVATRRKALAGPRGVTIASKRLTRDEQEAARRLEYIDDPDRPRTRGECGDERPCPYVSCKNHLYLDVNPETGSIKLNFPDLEVWEMAETCSLDVADRGGITLEEVGEILNLTRERIRQVEVRGLLKLKMVGPGEEPLPGDPTWLPLEDET